MVSKETLAELIRVLAYPRFALSAEAQQDLLADYLPFCTTVRMPAKLPKTPPCRDPFDVPFLEFAVVGKAAYLATGDKDLLALAARFSCLIVPADELLARL